MNSTSLILSLLAMLSILGVEANAGCDYRKINVKMKITHKGYDLERHKTVYTKLAVRKGKLIFSDVTNTYIFKTRGEEFKIGRLYNHAEEHNDILDKLSFSFDVTKDQIQNIVRSTINKNKMSEEEINYFWLPQLTAKTFSSEWWNFHGGTFQQLRANNFDEIIITSTLDPTEKMQISFDFGRRSFCH
jgi:predicted CopG family antitoxin